MIKREMLVMMHYDALETPTASQQGGAGRKYQSIIYLSIYLYYISINLSIFLSIHNAIETPTASQ